MNKFIKVMSWSDGEYKSNRGTLVFIRVDCIDRFYRSPSDSFFNFIGYSEESNLRIQNPTVFVTKKGEYYYSPIDLNNLTKFDIEEIDSRFDILDI